MQRNATSVISSAGQANRVIAEIRDDLEGKIRSPLLFWAQLHKVT